MAGLGKQGYGVEEPSNFTAWVILPPVMDRKVYINKCYQTGTVLIKSVDNQIETYVQVDKGSIHLIRFPQDSTLKGSALTCVKDPIYRASKVVAILQDPDDDQTIFEENQWRIHKRNVDNFVDIDAKGNTGEFDITVSSSRSDVISNWKFLSKNRNATLSILVQGKYILNTDDAIEFNTEKEFKITVLDSEQDDTPAAEFSYQYGVGFILKDQYENEITTKDGVISAKTKNGEEFLLEKNGFTFKTKKEDLKKILKDFISDLSNAQVTTSQGPAPFAPTTIQALQALDKRLDNLFK